MFLVRLCGSLLLYKTVILQGDLEEDIYPSQPKGYIVVGMEDKACKLKKSLYNLNQALRQWYEIFDIFIIKEVRMMLMFAQGSLRKDL